MLLAQPLSEASSTISYDVTVSRSSVSETSTSYPDPAEGLPPLTKGRFLALAVGAKSPGLAAGIVVKPSSRHRWVNSFGVTSS